MSDLYELHHRPDLESPVLLLATEGWIDAGLAGSQALASLLRRFEGEPVATFDADDLLDHRARRPTMHIVDGVHTSLTWPSIELRAGTDERGADVLLLVGSEPDHRWRAFSGAVVDLALELGVRLVCGLGAYPAPTPHTRPSRLASTATTEELAAAVGFIGGSIAVPGGVQAAIERRCAEVGLPAVGLWAQVPHYAAGMPYPAGAVALLDGLEKVADLHYDARSLAEEAAATRARLDELVAGSDEHRDLVVRLERDWDERTGARPDLGDGPLPSGDDLAEELERFLREQGD